MGVVCLFLNFVPLCKFLFEQQFLCNKNLLYCVTLLSACVFQRLGVVEVEWGVIFSFQTTIAHAAPDFTTCAHFLSSNSSCPELQSTYCSVWRAMWTLQTSSCVSTFLVHSTSLLGPIPAIPSLALLPQWLLSPQAATFAIVLSELTKPPGPL